MSKRKWFVQRLGKDRVRGEISVVVEASDWEEARSKVIGLPGWPDDHLSANIMCAPHK